MAFTDEDYQHFVEFGDKNSQDMSYEDYRLMLQSFCRIVKDRIKKVKMPTTTRQEIHDAINEITEDDLCYPV